MVRYGNDFQQRKNKIESRDKIESNKEWRNLKKKKQTEQQFPEEL